MWKMTADEQKEGETTALQRKDQTGTLVVADSGAIIGVPPPPDDVLCSECSQTTQPDVAKPVVAHDITIALLMDRAHRCRAHRQVRSQVDRQRAERATGGQSQPRRGCRSLLQASGHVGWAKECGRAGRGARGSHRRRPLPRTRLTARRAGSTICAWASGMLPKGAKPQRCLLVCDGTSGWNAPAKRCSPTRGWPMLLIAGSRVGLPVLSHELFSVYHAPFPSPPSTNFHHTSAAPPPLIFVSSRPQVMIKAGP
jgi:hypothetical protein